MSGGQWSGGLVSALVSSSDSVQCQYDVSSQSAGLCTPLTQSCATKQQLRSQGKSINSNIADDPRVVMTEAVVFVIDTGVTASQRPEGGNSKSYLDLSLEVASVIVERKLFSESKDDVAVVLLGSEETNNNLGYEGVNVIERGLAPADWDLIAFLREHVTGSDMETDWLDGVTVACDVLKNASDNKPYCEMQIVLISDLGCAVDVDQLELIVKGMGMIQNIVFTCICPDTFTEDNDDEESGEGGSGDNNGAMDDNQPSTSKGEPSKRSKKRQYPRKPVSRIQRQNLDALQQLIGLNVEMNELVGIEQAVEQLLFRKKKFKKPFPWKVTFELGPDIRINLTGYVYKRREPPKNFKLCLAKGSEEELKADTKYYRNDDEENEVDPDDVVLGFKYGQELVAISEQDEAAANVDCGPKAMSLFGFLPRDQVPLHQLVGDGVMAFCPSENDTNSGTAVSAMVRAMQRSDTVAVVRRVYRQGTQARLGALIPDHNDQGQLFLCFVELPFSEDLNPLEFASLPPPKEEQEHIMDELIETMMLAEQDEEGNTVRDSLDTNNTLNPNTQYLFQSLSFRARNPGRVLPPVQQHILETLEICEEDRTEIERCSNQVFEEIRKIFKTKINEKELNKRKRSEAANGDDGAKRARSDDSDVTEVGTVTPVEDFRFLLSHTVSNNTTFHTVSQQLETVILNLLNSPFGAAMSSKIVSCLSAYREECVARSVPHLYNEFLKKLKSEMGDESKLLLDIAESNVGLIADSEVAGGVSDQEAMQFFLP